MGAAISRQITPSHAKVKRPAEKTPRERNEILRMPFLSAGYFFPYNIVDVRPITVGNQMKSPMAYPTKILVAKYANAQPIKQVNEAVNIFLFVLSFTMQFGLLKIFHCKLSEILYSTFFSSTSNLKLQTSNLKPQTSNLKLQTSNIIIVPNKRILITGAAGFLGSHLCDRFIKEGYDVIGMDNLITGDLKNIEHLFKLKNFEFYHHDVSKFIHVTGKLDYILHFASPASPIDYLKIPIQTLKVGSLGTHNCLGLALAKNARILVASTSEVYGDPQVHPQNENYWGNVNPVGPRGVYDEAKRFQEAITMAYHTFHKVDTRIIRIFNTFGPRMRLNDGRALPAFIGQALRGEDLTVFGDGSQTRSFCYVDDLIEGIYRLLMSDYHLPVNVGNPDEISLKEFAEEIIKLTGTKQKIVYKPLPVDDPKQRQPDISKAKEILNWQPTVNRQEGLKITYEYFKNLPKEELNKLPKEFK